MVRNQLSMNVKIQARIMKYENYWLHTGGPPMNYYDYFPEEEHMDEDVPMDEFIAEATRTDIRFQR